ncbi:MAG TPA: hypothetical protein VM581_00985 [Magnetospirillaceae bacterium]|nr:hypothetical protein [Magnetospirillaceae bacterium]
MTNKKQSGFSLALVSTVIIVIAVVGFVVLRMLDSGDASKQNLQQTSDKSGTQTSQQQDDPNVGYVVVSEWGVRFRPVDGLTGTIYFRPHSVTSDAYTFTTTELANKEANCGKDSRSIPIGLLTRSKDPNPADGGVIAVIDGYSYQYRAASAACSESETSSNLENSVASSVSESIESLEAAK